MAFRIRADIAIPPKVNGRTRYPYFKMKVGDSFDVPLEDVKRIRVTACLFGQEHRMKFAVRRVDPLDKSSPYRCWRVK